MKTVRDVLRDADPVRHEPPPSGSDRERIRRAVTRAVSPEAGRPFSRRRLLAVAASAAALFIVAAAGPRLWFGNATLQAAAVRFEARLAESMPTLDLIPVHVAGSNRTIYLHREAVVTNEDVANARVVPGSSATEFQVAIVFTPAGAAKMQTATTSHLGRPLALLIDGEVVMAPTIRAAISDQALLTGNYPRAEAERIAAGMVAR